MGHPDCQEREGRRPSIPDKAPLMGEADKLPCTALLLSNHLQFFPVEDLRSATGEKPALFKLHPLVSPLSIIEDTLHTLRR